MKDTIEAPIVQNNAILFGCDFSPFRYIPDHPPKAELKMSAPQERQRPVHALRHRLAHEGYQEVLNFGFIDPQSELQMGQNKPITVLNPIASQYGVMRSNLWGGLLQNLRSNLNRGAGRVRIFEIGRVFTRDASQIEAPGVVAGFVQTKQVGGLAYGYANPEQWALPNRLLDFFDVKGDLQRVLTPLQIETKAAVEAHPALHPGRSAHVYLGDHVIGWIGELHPALQQAYELSSAPVLFALNWDAIRDVGLPVPTEISKFPAVQRDLAVVVDQSVPAQSFSLYFLANSCAFLADHCSAAVPCVAEFLMLSNNDLRIPGFV